jgi:hypothetical protein
MVEVHPMQQRIDPSSARENSSHRTFIGWWLDGFWKNEWVDSHCVS